MIYVVSHYYLPLVNPPATRMGHLVHFLVDQYGADNIRVVTGQPNYPDGKLPQAFTGRLFKRTTGDHGETVHHLYEYPTPFRGLVRKSLGLLSFAVGVFFYFLFRRLKPDDLVIVTSGPSFPPYAIYFLSTWKKNLTYVIDVRDLWPQVAAGMGYLNTHSWKYRLLDHLSNRMYRGADKAIGVSRGILEHLKHHVDSESLFHIPNPIDMDLFKPVPIQGKSEVFTVVFTGAFSFYVDLMTLMKAISKIDSIRVLLIGDGEARPEVEQFIQENELEERVLLQPFIKDKNQLVNIINSADLCYASLRASPHLTYATPTKILEYLSCNKPVLALLEGSFADELTTHLAAIVREPGNVAELQNTIERILEDGLPPLKEPRSFIEANYSLEKFNQRLASFFLHEPRESGR